MLLNAIQSRLLVNRHAHRVQLSELSAGYSGDGQRLLKGAHTLRLATHLIKMCGRAPIYPNVYHH